MAKNIIHQTWSTWRDWVTPVSRTSTFRETGKITPEEFVRAGDYLVYKFPSWQWADASTPAQRVPYLPPGKQYLVTRGVPCHRRLNDDFAGAQEDVIVQDMLRDGASGSGDAEDDGWLQTGGGREFADSQEAKRKDVRTVDEAGNVGEREEDDDEIPDMEDDDDDEEAIIRDPSGKSNTTAPVRTYNLYITYANYYRTPRLYLSGYQSGEPLPPHLMMEDIVGDYKDKTVTLEDFPWFDTSVPMATVHPCQHASVMKTLLDRADAALKLRRQKLREARSKEETTRIKADSGLEGLVDDTKALSLGGAASQGGGNNTTADEWEVLQHDQDTEEDDENAPAIRVDQYLVVFLKFIASVTPGIEHDFTMGV
ncbi:hypothetical protein VTN31DRAFT_4771 [Thermomyces dupontii]|uniref:uncharacterized protein n=1 Tax=Talaromyces thermophilus TaxID=28565 RepID=UPI0037430C9E